MEDKQAIRIMIFIYGLTFFMSLAVVSIPVLLNPNRGLTQGEFLVNEVHLEEMIDDYLRELYNKIEIEMEILRDIAFGKKMQLEDIILNIGLTVKEYNDRVNLIAENNERLNILKPKKEALEKEIKDINNRISEIEREISNERNKEDPDYGKINTLTSNVEKLKNELREKEKELQNIESRILSAEEEIEIMEMELEEIQVLINELDKEYLSFLKDENYIEEVVAGFGMFRILNERTFVNEMKKHINKMFLLEINSLVRPDTKVRNEVVTVSYTNATLPINSKDVIRAVLDVMIQKVEHEELITYDKNYKNLEYKREFVVFEGFNDELAEQPIYNTYLLEPIHYYQKNRIHNYYVINDPYFIIEKLLEGENIFKEVISADGLSKEEVMEYFELNLTDNWVIDLNTGKYLSVEHFKDIEKEVEKRKLNGGLDLVSKAARFMSLFNGSELSYLPGQGLEGDFATGHINNMRVEIEENLLPLEAEEVLAKIKAMIPEGEYLLLTEGELKVWEEVNRIKIEELTDETYKSEKILVEEVGNIFSGKRGFGIGDIGFLQYIFDNRNMTFLELYSNSLPITEKEKLKPGDLALYHSPEFVDDVNNIFGVYAGDGTFYHFNSYKALQNPEQTNIENIEVVKAPANFTIFMRYFPVKE